MVKLISRPMGAKQRVVGKAEFVANGDEKAEE
jgi:hypothetical protein